jgi:hypothetical protein
MRNDRSDMSKRIDFDPVVARVLLDLADNPKQVKTDTQGSDMALLVPDDLWERYEKYQGLQEKKGGKK